MNNTILASQGMMQKSYGLLDVIMAWRVMDEKLWGNYIGVQESRVQKEGNGIHRLCT